MQNLTNEQNSATSLANVDDVPAGEMDLVLKSAMPDFIEVADPKQKGKTRQVAATVFTFSAVIPEGAAGALMMLLRDHTLRVTIQQPANGVTL